MVGSGTGTVTGGVGRGRRWRVGGIVGGAVTGGAWWAVPWSAVMVVGGAVVGGMRWWGCGSRRVVVGGAVVGGIVVVVGGRVVGGVSVVGGCKRNCGGGGGEQRRWCERRGRHERELGVLGRFVERQPHRNEGRTAAERCAERRRLTLERLDDRRRLRPRWVLSWSWWPCPRGRSSRSTRAPARRRGRDLRSVSRTGRIGR